MANCRCADIANYNDDMDRITNAMNYASALIRNTNDVDINTRTTTMVRGDFLIRHVMAIDRNEIKETNAASISNSLTFGLMFSAFEYLPWNSTP